MNIKDERFEAICLTRYPYKENDALVKLFLPDRGKIMFLVKRYQSVKNPIRSSIFPGTRAIYLGRIREEGLSYLSEASDVHLPLVAMEEINVNAYLSYVCELVNVSVDDHVPVRWEYDLLKKAITQFEAKKEPRVVANIFELQVIKAFGINPELTHCRICGKTSGIFDYSVKYDGLLCEEHFDRDLRRLHWTPRAAHFIKTFSTLDLEHLGEVHLEERSLQDLRLAIDQLYEEYVGVHLKTKKFIDQMEGFKGLSSFS